MNKSLCRIYTLTVILFFLHLSFYAQEGLTFISNDKPKNERTSYRIFDKQVNFKNSLEVSFEMSFYSPLYIGDIFTVVNKKTKKQYSLYYKYTYDDVNKSFIQINRIGEEKLHEQRIPDEIIMSQSWIQVNLKLDFLNDKIIFDFNGKKVEISQIFENNSDYYELVFGKHDIYSDIPSFKIRNLNVKNFNTEYKFPLNQRSGNIVYDKTLNHQGFVENPYWLIRDFYFWKKQKSITSSNFVDVVFNKKESCFYLLSDNYLLRYNALDFSIDTLKYKNSPKFVSSLTGKGIMDYENNRIYLYKTSLNEIAENDLLTQKLGLKINDLNTNNKLTNSTDLYTIASLDINSLEWKKIDNKEIFDKIRFHNNSILRKNYSKLLFFGGYSNFRYHNDFTEYDLKLKNKTIIDFEGDKISPRYFSGHTIDSKNKLYIYGGIGNLSGEEYIGKKYFNDLYQIDIDNKIINKKWSNENNLYDTASSENILLSDDELFFYSASYADNITDSKIQLRKIKISDGTSKILGDTIPFLTNKFPNKIDIFQLNKSNRILLYKKEFLDNKIQSNQITFYSIEFEPVNYEKFNEGQAVFYNYKKYIYILSGLLIIIFICVLIYIINHRRKNDASFKNYIFVRSNRQNVKLFLNDIWAIEALKDYIKIVCSEKTYIVHSNISKFKGKLPSSIFIRVHRSFIININKITSVEGDVVYLEKRYYKIGGKYMEQIKDHLKLS